MDHKLLFVNEVSELKPSLSIIKRYAFKTCNIRSSFCFIAPRAP